ncbi:MAG: hypothetical protein A2X28_01935 [Elusimicrobia bacterium GWA2_56_46]|nr:MAG: hypothetical protein A2X28_01935 [Elusimicrobia bacterium GWA2_56_46]OGR55469.1 MAG: hypothetical protein A2X39_01030 [Elusimicrobia bacterium GWC2_56_31]HBW21937.1 hypothetical protein [Elusimicrobiota bacterium]
MPVKSEENGSDCDEIDLLEVLSKFKTSFAKYKYWMLGAPVAFAFLGFGLSNIQNPQWSGTAVLKFGRVSSSEFVEPLDIFMWRLGTAGFRESVLKKSGIPLGSPEAILFQNSLSARQIRDFGLIEIKVRGFSRESALKLVSATGSEICDIHASMITQTLARPKRHLAAIEKLNQDIAVTLGTSKQLPSENKSLLGIAAAYLAYETVQIKFSLLDQIDFLEFHPTILLEESAVNAPISPRKSLWIGCSAILGLFLAIMVSLALNSIGASNRSN